MGLEEILRQMFSGALVKDFCSVLYPQPNHIKERTIKNKNEVISRKIWLQLSIAELFSTTIRRYANFSVIYSLE
jgi:hypothetical protein